MERTDFFLEIDFYINKTLHRHWRIGKVHGVVVPVHRVVGHSVVGTLCGGSRHGG